MEKLKRHVEKLHPNHGLDLSDHGKWLYTIVVHFEFIALKFQKTMFLVATIDRIVYVGPVCNFSGAIDIPTWDFEWHLLEGFGCWIELKTLLFDGTLSNYIN